MGLWWTSLFLRNALAEGHVLTGINRLSGALISVTHSHRRQFSVPRCNAHRAERLMEKRDEAHNTVANASRDRKGVFDGSLRNVRSCLSGGYCIDEEKAGTISLC
jgi:hypothetical protein